MSSILFWQQSNAVATRQTYLAASAIQPAPVPTPMPTPLAVTLAAPAQPVTPTSATPIVPTSSPIPIAQANLKTIATCNGQPGNANFRSAPSLAPGTVLGVIAQGEAVALTGRTAIAPRYDAKRSDKAIALNSLHPSTNFAALNRTQVGQTGWIAACFIN